MAKSLISIDTISFDICGDIGDSTFKHRAKILRHLITGYSEVSRYIGNSFNVRTEVLKVDNSIDLPCDFVYETKIGIRKNGHIAILTLDKGLEREKLNDTDTQNYLCGIWNNGYYGYAGYWFYNAYRGNLFLGELYGAGRTVLNNGTYNIDRDNGVLYVGSHIPKDAEIVIEYKSDGISGGLSLVPMEMMETLINWAKWKFYLDRDNVRGANYERLYKLSYNKIQRLYNYETALYATGKINEMYSPTNY